MKKGTTPPSLNLKQLEQSSPLVSVIAQHAMDSPQSILQDGDEVPAEAHDEEVIRMEGEVERLEVALRKSEKFVIELQERNLKLKDELIETEKKLDRSEQTLQQTQNAFQEQEQKSKSQLSKMEKDINLLKSEVTDLTQWKDKCNSLTKQLDRYRTEIERLSDAASRVAELESELESKSLLESDMQLVMREVSDLKAKVDDLRDKLATKTAEAYELEVSATTAKQQIQQLKLELEHDKLAKQDMQAQVEDLVRKNTQGKSDSRSQAPLPMTTVGGTDLVVNLRQKISTLENQLATMKNSEKMQELEEKCNLLERTNRILRDKVESCLNKDSATGVVSQTSTQLNQDRLLQSLRESEASNKALHVLYTRLLAQCGLEILKLRTITASVDD